MTEHFRSFWLRGPLSPYERMCIRSFLMHGHRFTVYSYDRDLNIPHGCDLADAGSILPETRAFRHKHGVVKGSLGAFSDMFRYTMLAEVGAWWVDLDVVCLSESLPKDDYVFGHQTPGGRVSSAVLKVPRGSPFIRHCRDFALGRGEQARWGEIGPRLVTSAVEEFGLQEKIRPAPVFFPHAWDVALDVLNPSRTSDLLQLQADSLLTHLWNEIFRQEAVDKYAPPPAGSLLALYMERYGH